MKKKILSLILCVMVSFGALFTFSGCSTVKDDTNLNNKVVVTVGDKDYSQNDVLNSFYSFIYSNYALIYNGTDSNTIENMFYNTLIKDEIAMQKAMKALDDGTIKYYKEDEEDVWEDVGTYFRNQVNSYEKELYDDEADYPVWLISNSQSNKKSKFESYKSLAERDEKNYTLEAEKLEKDQLLVGESSSKFQYVFNSIFNYVSSIELDEEDNEKNIYTPINSQENASSRREAYAKYMQNLNLNAKAKNEYKSDEELLLDEIYEVYEAYYKAKISEIFEKYYKDKDVLEDEETGAKELKDEEIVKIFLESLKADSENFLNESDYVSAITGKDTRVILYHNSDKFFTVQHILLKFADELVSKIEQDEFYVNLATETGDVQYEIFEQFVASREKLAKDFYNGSDVQEQDKVYALTDINEDQAKEFKSIKIDGYYGYYTFDAETGYTKVSSETEGAKKMASERDIINCYNYNFSNIMSIVDNVLISKTTDGQEDDILDILKAVLQIQSIGESSGKTDEQIYEEIKQKVSTMLYIELSWIFSDDGLDNTLYKQLGYVVSNYTDENNGFTQEFVDLSKKLYAKVKSGDLDVYDLTLAENITYTKDGLHIIKIDNVFEKGKSLIDISGIDTNDVNAVINLMKNTYIMNGTTETVYDYYYDMVYDYLAGSDDKTGNFYETLKNTWLQEYLSENKISYKNKLSYDELMNILYA